MDNNTADLQAEQSKKVRNTVGFLLTAVMLALTVYILRIESQNYQTLEATTELSLNANVKQAENYRHYVKKYVSTKEQLVQTQARLGKMTLELELVNKELESTKSMLLEAESLLAQSQEENKALKGDPQSMVNLQKISAVNSNKEAETNLTNLKKKNEHYSGELAQLKNELNNYNSNVNDLKEGAALINEFKGKIKTVKENMRALQKEARMAKIAAQAERDRQLIATGNNGYATKDGQLRLVNSSSQKTVDIDVKFVP